MKASKNTSKSSFSVLVAAFLGLLSLSAAPGLSNDKSSVMVNSSSDYSKLTLYSDSTSPAPDGSPKTNLALDLNNDKSATTAPVNPAGLLGGAVLKAVPEPASFVLGVCVLALIGVLSARARAGRSSIE